MPVQPEQILEDKLVAQLQQLGYSFVAIMDEKDLLLFKEQLEAMKAEINIDVEQTLTEMTSQTGNIPDPNDRATMESDRSFELRIRGRERKLMDKVEKLNISMCGCAPAIIMIAAAKALGAKQGELVQYQTSGDVSGDKSSVVGYAGITIN